MWLVAINEQLREEEGATGGGEDGIYDDLTGGTMVGMVEGVGFAGEEIGGVAAHQNIGGELADRFGYCAPRVHIGNKITVRAIDEVDFFGTDNFGGITLFLMAALTEVIP